MPFWKRHKQRASDKGPEIGSILASEAGPSARLSRSVEQPGELTGTAQYGMFIFQNKPSDESKVVDIVAVHGLNGHYQKTWTQATSQGEVNWLQDLLPQQVPSARIMSYSYNSAVILSKAAAGIKTFAEQLLEDLIAWRITPCEQNRPIIFICHSLGGIVFKQVYDTLFLPS